MALGASNSTPVPTMGVSTQSGAAPHSSHSNIPTTIQPLLLARLLHSHPNTQFVSTFITHLCHGFDLGYQGPHRDIQSPNLPFAAAHPQEVSDYLQKECVAGRMAGPFPRPPFFPFHFSGLGVFPKQDGSWQVITHLSAPGGLSINDYIDAESVTLSYTTVDHAVQITQQLGRGTLLAKINLKRAFRQCPVWPADWHLLGLHWQGEFYHDKCLPFGLHSSSLLCDTLASALEHVFRNQLNNPKIIHYLDDFLIAAPPHTSICLSTFSDMEDLCDRLGIATKKVKRTPPSTALTFLDVQIDTTK